MINFHQPQRLSATGIIIMGADSVMQVIRAVFIPLIILLLRVKWQSFLFISLWLLGFLLLVLIFSYIRYRRFTFYIDAEREEFILKQGVFTRSLTAIPLHKIQQVNINQSLIQKLIGVYSLQIDTAGTDKKEIDLKAINEQVAQSLKKQLLAYSFAAPPESRTEEGADNPAAATHTGTKQLLKLSNRSLLRVGLTSHYGASLLLLAGFLLSIFRHIKELVQAFGDDEGQVEEAIRSSFQLFSLGFILIAVLGILLLINIIRTFIRYFEFEILKQHGSLHIRTGLFAKTNTILSARKVQVTTCSQNYFQRLTGIFNLNLKQANAGHDPKDKEQRKQNLEIPGCSDTEKDELLRFIFGCLPEADAVFKPDWRFLNLPLFFRIILPAVIFGICSIYMDNLRPYYPLLIAYIITGSFMIYRSYRNHALKVSRDFIIKKSGIWDISEQIITPPKIQSITTFQYPWHRAVDVGHVAIYTAAGHISFKYGNYSHIKKLVNYWLYQVESKSNEWM